MFRKTVMIPLICLMMSSSVLATPAVKRQKMPAVTQNPKIETPPASPAPVTKQEPYFTGFNGYSWGTPMTVIMKDAKPKTIIGNDLFSRTVYESFKANGKIHWQNKIIRETGFAVRSGFEYYGAVYGKNDGKYPFVIYVARNGRLVAGACTFFWNGVMPARLQESREKINQIMNYVENNYPDAEKSVMPRYNAFNAILQYATRLKAYDEAGKIEIALNEGTGLQKNAPDFFQIILMSQEYLVLTGQDKESQRVFSSIKPTL